MKKLFFLVSLVVLLGVSSAWAQSTGALPYPGATHTYQVVNNGSASYSWKIYKGTHATQITAIGNGIAAAGFASNTNSISITWASNAAVDDEYLIEVTETVSGCPNSKAFPVKITASAFDLTVAANNACYNGPVTVAWNGGITAASVTYSHGTANLKWDVTIAGINTNETVKFKPVLGAVSGIAYSALTVKQGSSTLSPDGNGDYTATGTTAVTVEAVATNNNTYNNSSALNAQDITINMELQNIASGTGALEKTTGGGANNANLLVSRPNTSLITSPAP